MSWRDVVGLVVRISGSPASSASSQPAASVGSITSRSGSSAMLSRSIRLRTCP
jgi:hypothetical protein